MMPLCRTEPPDNRWSEVYQSMLKGQNDQLMWALGQLKETEKQLAEARELLVEARRRILNLDNTFTESEEYEAECAIKTFGRDKLTPFLTPPETAPRFAVGDSVWSFNGQPRVVTGMSWAQAMRRTDQPRDYEPPWLWFLDTVDPDDPKYDGCGSEDTYRPRVDGVTEYSLAEAYWSFWKAGETA